MLPAAGPVITRTYYYAGAQTIALRVITGTVGNALYFLHADHLGSTSVTTCGNATCGALGAEQSRQNYYPYGSPRTGGGLPTDREFTGQYADDTGLMYYASRYYDPVVSRFVSPDTLIPGVINPQNFNRYTYAGNNPLKYTDPTGHWVESALDVAFILYDIYDISANGLNWENGLSLAADVGGLLLPVVTGGGLAVRAIAHADDVVDAARTANAAVNTLQAANQAGNLAQAG